MWIPRRIKKNVVAVENVMSMKTYNNIKIGVSENDCNFVLFNGQAISFPYRIYYMDKYETVSLQLSSCQRMIYHAIFTRSCDGFVREKHLKAILSEDFPTWVIPYIIKLTDEYVVEILDVTYKMLKKEKLEELQAFCVLNIQSFLKSHDRMISYWNEYYRNICPFYRNYIGKKLYSECLGYTKSMEKLRIK